MADKQVNWLLVGAGAIAAKRVAAALAGAEPGKLVGVCDIAEAPARRIATEYGAAEVYTDLDKSLAKTAANAVYVTTPVSRLSSYTGAQ